MCVRSEVSVMRVDGCTDGLKLMGLVSFFWDGGVWMGDIEYVVAAKNSF